jgi:hypothetical protein
VRFPSVEIARDIAEIGTERGNPLPSPTIDRAILSGNSKDRHRSFDALFRDP